MNVITKTLSGAEISVAIGGQNTEIRNDGAATVYASANAGIVAGADGVVAIPAGAAVTVLDTRGRVYLLGTGEVSVVGKDTVSAVFKCAPSAGGSGQDDVARKAIEAHAGNAEIHVTAEEKAAWNGKAEMSDIPTTLPANGGNADTIDGKHADDFSQMRGNIDDCDNAVLIGMYNATPETANTPYPAYWLVTVDTGSNGAWIMQTATQSNPDVAETYYRLCINGTWSNSWVKANDGGNADTLEGKHASDFVLKSDYDALEARVAALEARIAALENGGTA